MDDKNISDPQETAAAEVAIKRRRGFSLLDLMIAASVFAISFSIQQNTPKFSGTINLKDPIWDGVFLATMTVFTALTLFAAIQILRDWWSKEGHFHPGHLMVWIGILAIFSSVAHGLISLWYGGAYYYSSWAEGSRWFFAIDFFGFKIAYPCFATGLALYGSFTKASNWGWWWRVTFIAFAFCHIIRIALEIAVLSVGYSWLSWLGQVNGVIFILFVVLATVSIVADVMTKHRRDTSHWIGVVCGVGPPIFLQVFLMLALRHFKPSDIFERF